MKAKKESVNEKIDSLAIMVANGFAGVDKRFTEVDKRFTEVDKRFTEVDKRFDNLDKRFDELKRDFDQSFNEHIETIRSDYDGLTSRVKQLEITKK